MKMSLVIPCYNEAANLPLLVPRCLDVVKPGDIEVVLVDNGSSDASAQVMHDLLAGQDAVRNVRVEINQGYGYGILAGLRAARGDVLAWTHADMQTNPLDVLTGLAFFEQTQDPTRVFVKGRRYGRPLSDTVFTVGMSLFETILMQANLSDINAQPTMFHRRFFETWSEPPHDFSLDLYAFYMARRAGLAVKRFPVRFGERAHGLSHWNINWIAKRKFIERTIKYSLDLRRKVGS